MPGGAVGWVATEWVVTTNTEDNLETLPIQNNQPYFGAMQAITLNTGNNTNCGDFYTSGLLIQTPEGTARLTLRINEVTVEFIPSTNLGATAFIQSNAAEGMTVNMI